MDTESFFAVIIGSGFAGLGMAIRLKQAGIHDFVVLERANDLGGVWRDNSYPGCACDVESHLYSFSFAPNPNWSRQFSGQAEIHQYLRESALRFGIFPSLRCGQDMQDARWDEQSLTWDIQTQDRRYKARVLIVAAGAFSDPLIPDLKGLEKFEGASFHSAHWKHDCDLKGKRIAVVGTGASAIQFIPQLQPLAEQIFLFQRTPPWILPRRNRPLSESARNWFRAYPFLQKMRRFGIYLLRECLGLGFRHPRLISLGRLWASVYLRSSIQDRRLREKLRPRYELGCKRVLLSSAYYPALQQKNVEVITDGIEYVTKDGVLAGDGQERKVDVIIWGTGFQVTQLSIAKRLKGEGGRSLDELWKDSPWSYLGTTMPGFPNLFCLQGPNTGLGHNSVILMIEAQIELILKALAFMRRMRLASLAVKAERAERFTIEMDRSSQKTVWLAGGCQSWYLDKTGRNSTLWPRSVGAFRRRLLAFAKEDYYASKES